MSSFIDGSSFLPSPTVAASSSLAATVAADAAGTTITTGDITISEDLTVNGATGLNVVNGEIVAGNFDDDAVVYVTNAGTLTTDVNNLSFDSVNFLLKVVGAVVSAARVTAVKTAAYNAALYDFVRCDPSGGAFTVTLPALTAAMVGKVIVVKNTTSSATTVTIARTGADTIDGATTQALSAAYASLSFMATSASTWSIF